jgi:hypothetical protein
MYNMHIKNGVYLFVYLDCSTMPFSLRALQPYVYLLTSLSCGMGDHLKSIWLHKMKQVTKYGNSFLARV